MKFETARVLAMLQSLGMHCVPNGDTITVTPPSYRFDIAMEVDLIERSPVCLATTTCRCVHHRLAARCCQSADSTNLWRD